VNEVPHPLPRRRAGVELRDEESQIWLIDPSAGTAHLLNPMGRAIWELCDGTVTVEELAGAINQIFDVPRDRAAGDVEQIIGQFDVAGLVTWEGVTRERA
jgi:hypothetical protein